VALLSPHARRVLKLLVGSVTAVALMGATYQGIATSLERRAFPRPGRLVDVGTHQLHLVCAGKGAPTIVLEAAAGALSAEWADVQASSARISRVCSYDRAGLGWSEAGEGPFEPADVAHQLGLLLERANEPPPYVVVGHGLGASFAMLFAARNPRGVVAMVLVGSPAGRRVPLEQALADLGGSASWLARFGVLRLVPVLTRHVRQVEPASPARAVRVFLNRPDHLTRAGRELSRAADVDGLAAHAAVDGIDALRVELAPDHDHSVLTGEDARTVTAAIERAVLAARQLSSVTGER